MKKFTWLTFPAILIILTILILGAILLFQKDKAVGITDKLIIYQPKPNQQIQSPLIISGKARGPWFFEASFPIQILDEKRIPISTTFLQTKENWMTEEFIAFDGLIKFEKPESKNGFILFKKNNPSGLSEHEEQFEMPIKFK